MADYPLEEGFVSVEEMRLHYMEAGPKNGPPLVFLHGIGGGIEDWWANLGYFADQGYHVFAPSMPGHGASEYPSAQWNPAESGKTVLGLMDAWGISSAPLVGHSAAGIAVMLAALDAPDRVTSIVLAAPGGLTRSVGWPLRLVTIPVLGELLWQPRLMTGHRAGKTIFADEGRVNHRIMQEWVARHREPQQRKAFFHLLRMGIDLRGMKQGFDLRSRVRDIRCPSIIFWGEQDIIVPPPEIVRERLVTWREAELMPLSPCGHWPQIEQAGVFNQEVSRFLERVAARTGGR